MVTSGQSRTVTRPPVTSAAARNGAALERSGSTTTSRAAIGPGATRQPRSVAVTSTPCSRSVVTVISTCGIDGTPPASDRSMPSSKRAAASSSPETICEDSLASTVDRAAAHPAGAVHGERRPAAAAVVDLDAEGPQRGEQAGVGPLAQPRVAVHADRAVGQRGDRRQEAQHRAGQPGVDLGRPAQRRRA